MGAGGLCSLNPPSHGVQQPQAQRHSCSGCFYSKLLPVLLTALQGNGGDARANEEAKALLCFSITHNGRGLCRANVRLVPSLRPATPLLPDELGQLQPQSLAKREKQE